MPSVSARMLPLLVPLAISSVIQGIRCSANFSLSVLVEHRLLNHVQREGKIKIEP
jgi:hypothetical protein